MEITCTTLSIMTPHVKPFEDVDKLLLHLATIGYLDIEGTKYKAESGVTMTEHEYPDHGGRAYILNQVSPGGQRCHRIDFPQSEGAVTFEHHMHTAGVPDAV